MIRAVKSPAIRCVAWHGSAYDLHDRLLKCLNLYVQAHSKHAYVLFFNKVVHADRSTNRPSPGAKSASGTHADSFKPALVRRQSVSLPHLWPHKVEINDIGGRPTLCRLVSDDEKCSTSKRAAITELEDIEEE